MLGDVVRDFTYHRSASHSLLMLALAWPLLLWRAVVMDESGYYEAYYSLLDGGAGIGFSLYPSDESLLAGIEDSWPVQRLRWFSRGIYSLSLRQQDIVISDLHMGVEPHYAFNFKVGELSNPHAKAVVPEQLPTIRGFGQLPALWRRIWSRETSFGPGEGNDGW
jgi:inner membrane protein